MFSIIGTTQIIIMFLKDRLNTINSVGFRIFCRLHYGNVSSASKGFWVPDSILFDKHLDI